jgi:hypothetical protein
MAKVKKVVEDPSIQGKLLALTALLVTVTFWSQGTDPFNLPKLVLLVAGCAALIGTQLPKLANLNLKSQIQPKNFAVMFFILAMFLSFLFSGAPKLQMFYGVYARNTGMLNYLALALLFFFASELARKADYQHLLKYFLISSGIVIAVCLLEVMGVNVQRVSLIFKGSLIGTFGNPNFISAYLGMCGTVFFVLFLGWNERFGRRLILMLPILLVVGLILKSNSRQGLVVFLGGCAFTFFFYFTLCMIRNY